MLRGALRSAAQPFEFGRGVVELLFSALGATDGLRAGILNGREPLGRGLPRLGEDTLRRGTLIVEFGPETRAFLLRPGTGAFQLGRKPIAFGSQVSGPVTRAFRGGLGALGPAFRLLATTALLRQQPLETLLFGRRLPADLGELPPGALPLRFQLLSDPLLGGPDTALGIGQARVSLSDSRVALLSGPLCAHQRAIALGQPGFTPGDGLIGHALGSPGRSDRRGRGLPRPSALLFGLAAAVLRLQPGAVRLRDPPGGIQPGRLDLSLSAGRVAHGAESLRGGVQRRGELLRLDRETGQQIISAQPGTADGSGIGRTDRRAIR